MPGPVNGGRTGEDRLMGGSLPSGNGSGNEVDRENRDKVQEAQGMAPVKVIDLDDSQYQEVTGMDTQMVVREDAEPSVENQEAPAMLARESTDVRPNDLQDPEWLAMQRAMMLACEEHKAAAYRDWEEWEVRALLRW